MEKIKCMNCNKHITIETSIEIYFCSSKCFEKYYEKKEKEKNMQRSWKDIITGQVIIETNKAYDESNYHYGNPNTTKGEK